MKQFFKKNFLENSLIFFLIATIVYTFEQIFLGPFSYLYSNDTAMHALPKRISAINDFYNFGLHFWSPYIGGGADLYSSSNLFFSSIRESALLMFFFPPWLAFQIVLFASIFFAGYFTYIILRYNFKFSNYFSLFGAILYQSCVPYYFDIALSFLPFILVVFEKTINKKFTFLNVLIISITSLFYCSVTGLTYQFSCFALIIIWFFIFNFNKKKLFNIIIYLSILLSVFLIYFFPLILSLKQNSTSSHRTTNIDFTNLCENSLTCIPNEDFFYSAVFNTIFPWGIFYIFIIILGLYNYSKNINYFKFSILLLLFSLGTVIISILFKIFIPKIEILNFLKGFNTYRWGEPFSFLFVLSTIYCLNEIYKIKKKLFFSFFLLSFLLFFSYDQIYKKFKNIELYLSRSHSYVSIFENEKLKKISNLKKPFRGQIYPGEITTISWLAAYNIEEAGGFSFMIDSNYLDIWKTMVHGNYSNYIKFRNSYNFPSGEFMNFENISNEEFYEYRKLKKKIDIDNIHNINLLSLLNVKYIFSRAYLESESLTAITEIPKYLVEPGLNFQKLKTKIKLIFGLNDDLFNIYKNEDVLPRIYLVDKLSCFNNKIDLLDSMANSDLNNLNSTAYILNCNEKNFFKPNIDLKNTNLLLEIYEPDKIKVSFEIQGKTIMIVTNSYSKSWKAKTNTGDKEIFRVNHAFWGIYLDENDKYVQFDYKPQYMNTKLMIR